MTTQNGVKATKGASGDPKVFDRRMLMVVFVTLLIDLLAFTLILPLLPALLDYYGQHEEVGVPALPLLRFEVSLFINQLIKTLCMCNCV